MERHPIAGLDSGPSATVDFVGSVIGRPPADEAKSEDFTQGATWALKRLAAWLEVTNFVASDEAAQRDVNETKKLIAHQARQAAANLRLKK